jgi:ATP-binding cassette subfamily F protein 3
VAQEVWELKNCGIVVHQGGFQEYQRSLGQKTNAEQEHSGLDIAKANRKEQKRLKRLQAEQRNQAYALLRPLKKKYAELEGELEKNIEDQERLEMTLADPSIYADGQKVQGLNMEFANVRDAGDRLMSELAYLEKEIQEIEEQRDLLEHEG